MVENLKLEWNDFKENICESLRDIREQSEFFDVTLVCDDSQIMAHKVILSSCSPFFRTVLKRNPHSHPLLYLKGVSSAELVAMVNFMYNGEVNIEQTDLPNFLAVAGELSIKGLAQIHVPHSGSDLNVEQSKPNKHPSPRRGRPGRKRKFSDHNGDFVITDSLVKSELILDSEPESPQKQNFAVELYKEKKDISNDSRSEELSETGYRYEQNFADIKRDKDLAQEQGYDGNLEDAIKTSVCKVEHGAYNCLLCGKTCRDLTRARQHLEAKHFPSLGYSCPICEKHCKTKHALTCHVSVYHRDTKVGIV